MGPNTAWAFSWTSLRAAAACVSGVVGLTVVLFPCAVLAYILGRDELRSIELRSGARSSRALAYVGKVTGIVGIVMAVAAFLAVAVLLPSCLAVFR